MKNLFVEGGRLSLCNMCTALCCQNVEMPLSDDELRFMIDGGTHPVLRGNCYSNGTPVETRNGVKHFLSKLKKKGRSDLDDEKTMVYYIPKCGYLKQRLSNDNGGLGQLHCSAHSDPRRPAVCRNFRSGSYGCLVARQQAGLNSTRLDIGWNE